LSIPEHKKGCECLATIYDEERRERWKGIFENDAIPITMPLIAGRARTGNEEYDYYVLDVTRVSEEQKREIARRAAEAFKITLEQAMEQFEKSDGIPIKADNTVVAWCSLHSRMAICSDDFEDCTEDDCEYFQDEDTSFDEIEENWP